MTRSLTRRLVPVGLAGACLAASALPALAQTPTDSEDIVVEATGTAGGRQFHVYDELTDTTPGRLVFGTGGEQRFRVVVEDVAKELEGGFQVNASMTNLYWKDPETSELDPSAVIPSRNLSLGYDSTSPLSAVGVTVPVQPVVDLTGALPTCLDDDVASALGITGVVATVRSLPLVGGDQLLPTLLDLLSGPTRTICQALGGGGDLTTEVTRTVDALPLTDATTPLTDLLQLSRLPVSLVGGQEGGAFTNPAYKAVAAPADAPAATRKRIMSGSPQRGTDLLALVRGALETTTGAVYGTGGELLDRTELLAALQAVNPGLVTGVTQLAATSQERADALVDEVLEGLTPVLRTLDAAALSSVTGTYTARPVLRANTTTTRPGTYEGTLTIDFIDGVR